MNLGKVAEIRYGHLPRAENRLKEATDKISLAILKGDADAENSDITIDSDGKETIIRRG